MSYLAHKLFSMVCSLFIVVTLTFFLMKAIPGDPFSDEQALPKDIHEALMRHYGLDQPWHIQYFTFLRSIAHGDLGPSLKFRDRTVNDIIATGFPVSARLGIQALLIAIAFGTLLGTIAALKENQWQETAILLLTILGISVPSFILATLFQYLFAIHWPIFPLARWGSFSHTILPSLALAALPTAFIMRLMRSSLREVLQSDYIRTAKAKGLSAWTIVTRHGIRNAFLPVLGYLGQLTANILVGSFVIEKVFSIPGLGQWFVSSVSNRDYSVMMGLTIFYSCILLIAIFMVDIAYGILDPRIQLKREAS